MKQINARLLAMDHIGGKKNLGHKEATPSTGWGKTPGGKNSFMMIVCS